MGYRRGRRRLKAGRSVLGADLPALVGPTARVQQLRERLCNPRARRRLSATHPRFNCQAFPVQRFGFRLIVPGIQEPREVGNGPDRMRVSDRIQLSIKARGFTVKRLGLVGAILGVQRMGEGGDGLGNRRMAGWQGVLSNRDDLPQVLFRRDRLVQLQQIVRQIVRRIRLRPVWPRSSTRCFRGCPARPPAASDITRAAKSTARPASFGPPYVAGLRTSQTPVKLACGVPRRVTQRRRHPGDDQKYGITRPMQKRVKRAGLGSDCSNLISSPRLWRLCGWSSSHFHWLD